MKKRNLFKFKCLLVALMMLCTTMVFAVPSDYVSEWEQAEIAEEHEIYVDNTIIVLSEEEKAIIINSIAEQLGIPFENITDLGESTGKIQVGERNPILTNEEKEHIIDSLIKDNMISSADIAVDIRFIEDKYLFTEEEIQLSEKMRLIEEKAAVSSCPHFNTVIRFIGFYVYGTYSYCEVYRIYPNVVYCFDCSTVVSYGSYVDEASTGVSHRSVTYGDCWPYFYWWRCGSCGFESGIIEYR